MIFEEVKAMSINMAHTLGLNPDGYLDFRDRTLAKKVWEYLLPLAGKFIQHRDEENGLYKGNYIAEIH